MSTVYVVVTHHGHGEETTVLGVYATEAVAKAALVAAQRRAADASFMPYKLYGNVEKHCALAALEGKPRMSAGRSVTMSEELDAKRQEVIEAAKLLVANRVAMIEPPDFALLRSCLAALEGKPREERP